MPRFSAIAAALVIGGISGSALATECACTNIEAASSSNGTCSRTQSGTACEMTWGSGGTTKVGGMTLPTATERVVTAFSSRGDQSSRPFSFRPAAQRSGTLESEANFRTVLTALNSTRAEDYAGPTPPKFPDGSLPPTSHTLIDSNLVLAGGLLLRKAPQRGESGVADLLADVRRRLFDAGGIDLLRSRAPKQLEGSGWTSRISAGCFQLNWREIGTEAIIKTPEADEVGPTPSAGGRPPC